ncbi:MAG: hypothetical protein AAB402_02930, partial [Patescibacteria group bacterium]
MENHPHPTPPPNKGVFDGASPKLAFIFGLIAGVAITALIGLAVVLPKAYGSSKSTKTTAAATAPTNTGAPTAPTFNNVKPITDTD